MVDKIVEENKRIKETWKPLIEGVDAEGNKLNVAPVKNAYKASVTAQLLENTQNMLTEGNNLTAGIDMQDTVMINLVRRLAPNLMAYDMVGVQPMKGPTGVIFAMRAFYDDQPAGPFGRPGDARSTHLTGGALNTAGLTPQEQNAVDGVATDEAFYYEADTTKTGTGTQTSNLTAPNYSTYAVGTSLSTAAGEVLGTSGSFQEMGFTIEKKPVAAGTRKMKGNFTRELAQDLKAVHGLDAENELSGILATEINSEINREIVNTIRMVAKLAEGEKQYENGVLVVDTAGAAVLGTTAVFDIEVNSDGRWSNEKHKSLLFKIEKECNKIAKETRRGRGNFLIVSSNVASALQIMGKLVYAPAMDTDLNVDDTGNTFVGMLGNKKVYIDPFLGYDEVIVGYKGVNQYDAGMFYCPYTPVELIKAINPTTMQPVIANQTRYAITSNPFTANVRNSNNFYRKFRVTNL